MLVLRLEMISPIPCKAEGKGFKKRHTGDMRRMRGLCEITRPLFVAPQQSRWNVSIAANATASGFTQLHCTLRPVSGKSRYAESKSVRGQLSGLNLLVTRSKVFLSSGFGRTWQVRRFSLAGGRLIYSETARSGRKKWGGTSFFSPQRDVDERVNSWGPLELGISSPCCEKSSDSQTSLRTFSSATPSWFCRMNSDMGGKKTDISLCWGSGKVCQH